MEIKEEYKGFYTRFLGSFSLNYRGHPVSINANPQTRYMQILLCLLKAGEEGMSRKELLAMNQPDDKEHKQRSNNFRQQIHILRNAIARAGFPEGKYIVVHQSRYYFTREYGMQSDTGELDVLIEKLRTGLLSPEKRREVLLRYCATYTGEFLPFLNGVDWVTLESAYYQKWYTACLKELYHLLKEEGEFERLLALSTAASQYHPYDEWQEVRIECLMALDRRREAQKVYDEAVELYDWGWRQDFLEAVMSANPEESGICSMDRAMKQAKDELEEHSEIKKAYPCSFPSFVDICRIWARLGEKSKESHSLMLCSMHFKALSEEKEVLPEESKHGEDEKQESQMDRFREILCSAIRPEDVYTRYSKSQYLVLLTGMDVRKGQQMVSRLREMWKQSGKDGWVKFELSELDRTGGKENLSELTEPEERRI